MQIVYCAHGHVVTMVPMLLNVMSCGNYGTHVIECKVMW